MPEQEMKKAPPGGSHAGHRRRMREEFLRAGAGGMADHRLLEMLLFYAIPKADVNPLAHQLIDHFGSLAGVFQAPHDQLMKADGVGESTAVLIQVVLAIAARCMEQNASFDGQIVDIWQLKDLLEPYFFGQRDELAYLVCLDGKSKVQAVRKLGQGIMDTVPITARKVAETALGCNASQVVLAHNHVSGVAMPSRADVSTTLRLKRVLAEMDIILLDHLIFAGGDMVSMAQSGLLSGSHSLETELCALNSTASEP